MFGRMHSSAGILGGMVGAVLWQVAATGHPTIRCVLERQPGGEYTLHIFKGKEKRLVFVHDYADRLAALAASITMYRKFKDNGFHDTDEPIV